MCAVVSCSIGRSAYAVHSSVSAAHSGVDCCGSSWAYICVHLCARDAYSTDMNNELITINAEHTAYIRLPWIIINRQYRFWNKLTALLLICVTTTLFGRHSALSPWSTLLLHTIVLIGSIVVTFALVFDDILAEKIVKKRCRQTVQHIISGEHILRITQYDSALTINRAYTNLIRTEQGGITYTRQVMILGSKLYISAAKQETASY